MTFAIAGLIAEVGTAQAAVTVTQIAGQPINGGLTLPGSGVILKGNNGKRFLWYSDHGSGVCRLLPDIDSPGPYSVDIGSCVVGKPTQMTYDPTTQKVYSVDISVKNAGILVYVYRPEGNNGNGAIDATSVLPLAGKDQGCGIVGNAPNSATLGPDGNLYVGFKRSGNIVRIVAPETDPPCSNYQVIGTTSDGRKDFGLGFIGNDLYGADGFAAWLMKNATQCGLNGAPTCTASVQFAAATAAPQVMITNQQYTGRGKTVPGTTLFYGTASTITMIKVGPSGAADVTANYAGGFSGTSGLIADESNSNGLVLYVGDDTSLGLTAGAGRWWRVGNNATGSPTGQPVINSVTPGHAQMTLTFTPGVDTQPVTRFVVHTFPTPSTGPTVPDVTVSASPAVIANLNPSTAYQFTVAARNSVGDGPQSLFAPSPAANPLPITVPDPPTNVTAVITGAGTVVINWTPPADNGGLPLTGYQITVKANGGTNSVVPIANPAAIGSNPITGLDSSGATIYTFTMQAQNSLGFGAQSASSNSVKPLLPSDLSLQYISPNLGPVPTGTAVNYGIQVSNAGNLAPQATATVSIPASASLQSASASTPSGTVLCPFSNGTISCSLGQMNSGSTAMISFSLIISADTTTGASVSTTDGIGNTLPDLNSANNSQMVTTTVQSATPPPPATDLQVTGSVSNGGPTAPATVTYTWQIKNSGRTASGSMAFTNNLTSNGTATISRAFSLPTGCTISSPTAVSCAFGSIAAGSTLVVQVPVDIAGVGSVSNTGNARYDSDTNQANNTFTVNLTAK